MRTFQSRGATIALMVVIATGFFFAGYSAHVVRVAAAATPTSHPVVTPTPADGNPVGHYLTSKTPGSPNVMKCLHVLANLKTGIAIRYHTALPGQQPHLGQIKCANKQCVPFVWTKMDIYTVGPAPDYLPAHHETVDVYGTLSLK